MKWATKLLLLLAVLFAPRAAIAQQTGRISGLVTDSASGQPIPSATITVIGTKLGAATASDGKFSISNVPAGSAQVRVQRLGFAPRTQSVTIAAGQTTNMSVALVVQAQQLAAVVSVGYGNQNLRDVTGSVAAVAMDALEHTPIVSIDQMLQGTSPGVEVTTASSEPGGALSVRIRGTSSLTGNPEPLYVIDGFPIENDIDGASAGNGGRSKTTAANPMVGINPSDIESISILKDASATAIYGARGANGVVIITTKQGRGSKPTFTADYSTGFANIAKKYDLLNTAEYMDYANTFGQGSSTPYTPFPQAVKDSILKAGTNTDWQDEIFRTGGVHNLQLTMRGATAAASPTRYSLTGGYFNNTGIVLGSGLKRMTGRLNLNQSIGSRVEIAGSINASQVRSKSTPTAGQQNSGAGAVSAAIQYVPLLPVKNLDGSYTLINPQLNAFNSLLDAPQTPNPVSMAADVLDSLSDTRVLGNVYGQVELLDNLDFKVSLGTDYANRGRNTYYPRTTLRGQQASGDAIRAGNTASSWLNENTLTYQRKIGTNQSLNLLGGYTRQRTDFEGSSIANSNFVSDITGYNNIAAGTQAGGPNVSSRRSTQTLESYLARANYSLKDRYLFTGTVRRDGSSRFAENRKWGSFPSLAFAWRASEENFLKNKAWIDELKLRLSTGTVGNPSIRPYQSLARLNNVPYSFGGTAVAGYYPTSVANPDLTWETTKERDLGLDFAFLGRYSFTADYYKKKTTDLLLQISLPYETGFESALANRGAVQNEGFELGLDINIIKQSSDKRAFAWRANANFARNQNVVLDLGGPQTIFADLLTTDYNLPGTMIQVGAPVGVFYGFQSLGVIRDSAAAAAIPYRNFSGSKYKAGDMLAANLDGDTLITLADRTNIGNPTPKFTAGMTNVFSYRGVELSALVQGVYGNKILNINRIRTESSPRVNISRERYYGAWTPTNIDATFPKIGENPNQVGTNNFTDNLLEDGSYLRLRTVSLSFALPDVLAQKTRMQGARVYANATNLWTATHYTGFDPDVSSQSTGTTNRGIDIGAYPLSRSVTIGLNINY